MKGPLLRKERKTISQEEIYSDNKISFDNKELESLLDGITLGEVIEIFGPDSSGKCLSAHSAVLTPEGYITIEKVLKSLRRPKKGFRGAIELDGLKLINKKGQEEEVYAITFNGVKDLYRIHFTNGIFIDVTENHPLLSRDGFKEAKDLETGDMIMANRINYNIELDIKRMPAIIKTESMSSLEIFLILDLYGYQTYEIRPGKYGIVKRKAPYFMIEEIEHIGKEETYDFVMPKTHSFVANGVVNHNTSIALEIAEEVSQKSNKPAAFIDAEYALDRKYVEKHNEKLETMYHIEPDSGEGAFEMAERLLATRDISILVIDSSSALKPSYEEIMNDDDLEHFLLLVRGIKRLKLAARDNGIPVLVISQTRFDGADFKSAGGRYVKHQFSRSIETRRPRSIADDNLKKMILRSRIHTDNT